MPTPKKSKVSVRLPSHIKPTRYNITLKPDLEAFTYEGKEVIDILLDKAVKEITLHSKDLAIETVELAQGKTKQFANKISYDEKSETATFTFLKAVPKGKAKLHIVFKGIISENLRGFYKSRYEIDGVTKHIATTQFEATDARRAFPSFDEPAHKAIFDLSLIIPSTHTAISNTMPSSTKEHEGGMKVVTFAPTPKMSTYLLAFIIGEFEYVEGFAGVADKNLARSGLPGPVPGQEIRGPAKLLSGTPANGTQIRVFTTAGKKHQAKFALDVAIRSLEFYNDYFGIAYPLPTLDLIAIPDFESAAMENWGAVTFRETAILVDEEATSLSTKQWVAIVICHELAHQWFGNLVTMHWWTDLWLNEGFASYMEYYCTDKLFPEWKLWDLYLAERYSLALRLDALANSHPIEVPVHHPDEINEIFDAVSYAKGSAVIRMIAEYIGHDKFRDGMRYYMKKHSYGNTITRDLWDSLEYASKKPVSKMMNAWTKQTGYPLLTLSKGKNNYTVYQERFFSSRIEAKQNKDKTIWHTPFHYESNGELLKELMTKKSSPLIGKNIGKVNAGERTMARVRYDHETLAQLKKEIENNSMSVHDRLGVIRDLFALAEGGYIDTTVALEFALSYKHEKEFIVWSEIASGISRIYNIISDEPFKDKYKSYVLSLFSPLAERMGWDAKKGEAHSDTFLRNLALSYAGNYGDKKVIAHAQKLFKNRTKNPIRADIRSMIYGIVASNGTNKEWEIFYKLYKNEKHHEEQERYGRALTAFKDKTLLARTLTFALSKDVRTQDAPFLIGAVWQSERGRELTWQFVKHNWATLLSRYGEGGHFLSRVISPLGSHTNSKDIAEIKKFFKTHSAPGATRSIEQSLERIASNSAWKKADKNKIKIWLHKNYK